MKSAKRPSSRRASRVLASKPAAPKFTVTLELDRVQLDLLLSQMESVFFSMIPPTRTLGGERSEKTFRNAVSIAAEIVEAQEDENGLAYETMKLAPAYRALLAQWNEDNTKISAVRWDASDDTDLPATLRAAGVGAAAN